MNLIYNIRGKQVMFDSDVAMLYGYETKRINEAVKRNKNKFSDDFCFQLTFEELYQINRFNNKISRRNSLPHVFTEQGIAMLASVLKNNMIISVSIKILDAFFEIKRDISSNSQMFEKILNLEFKLLDYDKKINILLNKVQLNEQDDIHKIFYNGQVYDAYSLIVDIIESAENKIIIIDNYIDKSVLKILTKKKPNVKVFLITSNNCKLTKSDRANFNRQYPSLRINTTKKFHDRFIIIDDKNLYHCGASLKDAGKKCFAINKIKDEDFIEKINCK